MATITQKEVIAGASASEVYDALMDSKKHAEFTNAKAQIDNKVGGKFTAWDDYIEGESIELDPGKKIVQKWRGSDWTEGEYSRVTYTLKDVDGGCEIDFHQSDVPSEFAKDVEQGWSDYYWEPLRKYFAK